MLGVAAIKIVNVFFNGEILIRYDYTFAVILSIAILWNIEKEDNHTNIIDNE